MSKSRKGKRYNKMKGGLSAARMGLKNLAVWHSHNTESDYTAELINLKNFMSLKVDESKVFAVTKIRHKWQIILLAIGQDDTGKKYFKVDPVQIINEMYQSDLAEYLDTRHKKFVGDKFNKNHLTNVAWLAVPDGSIADRITDEQLDKLITFKKAW